MTATATRRLLFSLLLAPLVTACATFAPAPASGLAGGAERLAAIFADTALDHAHWGVLVRSLDTGETLYQQNAEKLFVPASNMKLVTGAAALEGLGPDYRYRTDFLTAGVVQNGTLRGNLVVRGGGDPTLSERFWDDERAVFRQWADSLRARGITLIAGSIVGVDSAFAGPPLGAGWAWDDLDAYYASEFGALQFNEGAVDVQIVPGRDVGGPAVVFLDPPTQYVPVRNQVRTVAAGSPVRLSVTRDPVGPGILVAGEVPADTTLVERAVAVRGVTDFFLSGLRESLREAGIAVEGAALDADELPEEDLSVRRATPLFTYRSPPLREILPGMMKPSQNWIAETLLLTLGRELRGQGTAAAGAAVVDSMFRAWGLDAGALRMADGSGLSRYDLVSPELLVGLLTRMDRSPHRELWLASLPVAGRSGTLERRMGEPPLAGNVLAKTGTLSGVRSLSGYLTTPTGERLIFATLINNHRRSAAAVDRVVEQALRAIAEGR